MASAKGHTKSLEATHSLEVKQLGERHMSKADIDHPASFSAQAFRGRPSNGAMIMQTLSRQEASAIG